MCVCKDFHSTLTPHTSSLLSEVEDVLGNRREVTGDDLDKMKYTEQVGGHTHHQCHTSH